MSQSRVERRKEKTRRMLIAGALELFHEKGMHWTKVEDITERADVGKGTFYRHFETKEALIQEVLQEGIEILLGQVQEALQSAEPQDSMAQTVIGAQLDFFLQHPEYLMLFHQIRGSLQMNSQSVKELRDVYSGYLARLAMVVRPAVHASPSGSSAREVAMALSTFTSELLIDHLLFDKGDVRGRRDALQAQLERSIHALM